MFKVVKDQRAWWPVTWNGVSEDGDVVENRIELRFLLSGDDEALTLAEEAMRLKARAIEAGVKRAEAAERGEVETAPFRVSDLYAEFVQRIAIDWRGVAAENGEALPFTTENLRIVMNLPGGVFNAAVAAWHACRAGGGKLREGN